MPPAMMKLINLSIWGNTTMQAFEVMGTINEKGQIILDRNLKSFVHFFEI